MSKFGGGCGGSTRIFVLSKDKKIEKIEGETCNFDSGIVVGRLTFTIKTSNGISQIGPIGYSGNPNGSERHRVRNTFTITDLNRTHFTDKFTLTAKCLGPPNGEVHWLNDTRLGRNDSFDFERPPSPVDMLIKLQEFRLGRKLRK